MGLSYVCCSRTHGEQEQAISQRPRDYDGVEAGELVGNEIVVGHAVFIAKIFGVGSGMKRPDRNDEAEPVSRGDFSAAP